MLDQVSGIDVQEIVELKEGAVVWHDRAHMTVASFPEYMEGGHYAKHAHRIANNKVISITVTGQANVYVALREGKDGGLKASLAAAGWRSEPGSVTINGCCELSSVFSKDSAGTLTLPKTTRSNANIMIVAVARCNSAAGNSVSVGA